MNGIKTHENLSATKNSQSTSDFHSVFGDFSYGQDKLIQFFNSKVFTVTIILVLIHLVLSVLSLIVFSNDILNNTSFNSIFYFFLFEDLIKIILIFIIPIGLIQLKIGAELINMDLMKTGSILIQVSLWISLAVFGISVGSIFVLITYLDNYLLEKLVLLIPTLVFTYLMYNFIKETLLFIKMLKRNFKPERVPDSIPIPNGLNIRPFLIAILVIEVIWLFTNIFIINAWDLSELDFWSTSIIFEYVTFIFGFIVVGYLIYLAGEFDIRTIKILPDESDFDWKL